MSIMHMQGELQKSIRDAEKGSFPLGPLISFKNSLIRRKTQPNVKSEDISGFQRMASQEKP